MIPRFCKYWLPVLLCSAAMFAFSSDAFSASHTSRYIDPLIRWFLPHASHALHHRIHFFLRKFAHWCEYFILALFFFRALRADNPRPLRREWVVWTLILILGYALGDEFHQSFVPSRTGSLSDSLLDFFGGSCAMTWKYLRYGLREVTRTP